MNARIRLLLPAMEECAARLWGQGGGSFGWADVEFTVNPVGSANLYQITKVSHEGREVDLETVLRLNSDAHAVDELIATKIHGKYAKEVQQQPITKRTRKKKPEPPKEEGQATMELPDL